MFQEDPSIPVPRKPPDKSPAPKQGGVVSTLLEFFGVVCVFLLLTFLEKWGLWPTLLPFPRSSYELIWLAAVPLALFAAVAVHEFGHLLGGWMTGGRFVLFSVGPFSIHRTPTGIRFSLKRSLNLWGGANVCLPPNPSDLTPGRAATMILAGPLFSLLFAVMAGALAVALSLAVGNGASIAAAAFQRILLGCMVISGLLFFVGIFPGESGGHTSDGKLAYGLLRGDRYSDQKFAVFLLSATEMGGTRPADYAPALLARALALDDGSLFDLNAHLVAYYHAADQQRWTDAQNHLDHVIAGEGKLPPYIRGIARSEYAWLLATRTPAGDVARAWLETADDTRAHPAIRMRAEAAVLMAEGRLEEARTKALEGLHALETENIGPFKSAFEDDALKELAQAQA